MDFLGLVFTPQGVVDVLAAAVIAGSVVGVFGAAVSLMRGR